MAKSFSFCLLLPFVFLGIIATATSDEYTAPKEKMTHLHFYFHEIYAGANVTTMVVAVPPGTNSSFTTFGALIVIDDMLREGPEPSSKLIGRAQGLVAQASQEGSALLTAFNFVFTEGEFNGSTLAILGRAKLSEPPIERSIVGGSGKFRMARGYTEARVISSQDGYFLMDPLGHVNSPSHVGSPSCKMPPEILKDGINVNILACTIRSEILKDGINVLARTMPLEIPKDKTDVLSHTMSPEIMEDIVVPHSTYGRAGRRSDHH
ncbi:hypothetical protein B296_00015065 [Ensete ventricosum]|uniref:Dirigent protein n=1 Tax=Ensete ventricosum TaxID=4639 RepID=A0A426ZLS7_ENSVE|nr:hypothetical protein B296_00015065 [Ensete ventricosum]